MLEGPRLDGYIRVSRRLGRSGESYISPSVQRDSIQRWADYKTATILKWIIDEDVSGGTHQRPGLERAVDRAVSGISQGIVCARIDRFSRFTEHGLRDLRRLEEAGARLAFVAEDIDTSGPMGKFVYVIMLAMAELFLDQSKASWIVAKTRAVERGAFIGPTPYGYQRCDDGTLKPDGERGEHVSEAFRLAASRGLNTAVDYLRAQAPGRRWQTSTVRRLFASRAYLGETRNGKLVKADTHTALVSRAVWEAAQHRPTERRRAADFPLSGLPICGSCGSPLVGSRGGAKGNRMRVYRCSATLSSSRNTCTKGVVIVADRLETHLRELAERELAGLTVEIGQPRDLDQLALLERQITEAETELEAFAGDLTMRRALGDRYHRFLQERVEAVESAQAAYRTLAVRSHAEQALRAPDVLKDPALLALVLRSIFGPIVVSRGRGLDRVRVFPADTNDGARVLGPVETK